MPDESQVSRIDTDAFARAVPEFASQASKARDLLHGLEADLDRIGKAWGTGKEGKAFERQYLKTMNDILEGLSNVSEALKSGEQGLDTTAKGFTHTENVNTDHADQVRRGLH
ncbi:WXG100 family type VII secretion target [Amycolatopsis japonica]